MNQIIEIPRRDYKRVISQPLPVFQIEIILDPVYCYTCIAGDQHHRPVILDCDICPSGRLAGTSAFWAFTAQHTGKLVGSRQIVTTFITINHAHARLLILLINRLLMSF